MAVKNIGTTHELTAKLWAEGLEAEVLKKISVMDFMGKSSRDLCQYRDRLSKEPGDVERVGLRLQSEQAPKTSGQSVEGSEQTLNLMFMDVTLDEYADAFRWDNIMSRQRVTFEHRDEAKAALSDQLAHAYDRSFFTQISGNTSATSGGPTEATFQGHNTVTEPEAANHIIPGVGTEIGLVSTDVFTLDLISEAVQQAKTNDIAIRPADIGYPEDMYVCFLHPWQVFDLKQSTSRWTTVMRDAMQGSMIGDNPQITGALGVWDGCLLVENSRVPRVLDSTAGDIVRRAVLCGAQSAMSVWGRIGGTPERLRWVEKLFDFDREMGVLGGFVAGIKKSVFREEEAGPASIDFATIVISTATQG